MNVPKTGETWQHYKTKGIYEIICIAKMQSKTKEEDYKDCVIYKDVINGLFWVRPLEDFLEKINLDEGKEISRFMKEK